jgi:hypothetical protein
VAAAAYDKPPVYDRYALGQLIGFASVQNALRIVEERDLNAGRGQNAEQRA